MTEKNAKKESVADKLKAMRETDGPDPLLGGPAAEKGEEMVRFAFMLTKAERRALRTYALEHDTTASELIRRQLAPILDR